MEAKDWEIGTLLGEGSFARVHRATLRSTGEAFALKIVDSSKLNRYKREEEVVLERQVLTMLPPHPGIVKLVYEFSSKKAHYFALELLSGGELLDLVRPHGLRLTLARYYLAQVLSALQHVHACGVVYRDLKPENCVLTASRSLKLVDFGSAKVTAASGKTREFVGTPNYMSPEAIGSRPTSARSDMWSLGALTCQLLSGTPPFTAGSEFLTLRRVQSAAFELPEATPRPWAELVGKLLRLQPLRRLTARGVWASAALGGMPPGEFEAVGYTAFASPPPPCSADEETVEERLRAVSDADGTSLAAHLASGTEAERALLAFEMGRRGLLQAQHRLPLGLPAAQPAPFSDADLTAGFGEARGGASCASCSSSCWGWGWGKRGIRRV